MTCRLVGISAVVLMLLSALTIFVPSAFAEETDIPNADSHAQSAFDLMNLITSGQTEAATLSGMIENNGLNVSLLDDYIELLEDAAALVAEDEFGAAEALLNEADELLADVYDEIYDEIDSHQDARLTEFVQNAIDNLTFIVENGRILGISDAVIDELEATLAVLENGDYDEILATTGETSNLGLTILMFPEDHPGFGNASPVAKDLEDGKAKGIGIGLGGKNGLPPRLDKLPPGIKDRYQIPTGGPSAQSTDGTDGTNGLTNGRGSEFFRDIETFTDMFPGFGAASENANQDNNGIGIGLGKLTEGGKPILPPGIAKKFDPAWNSDYGFSPDDAIFGGFEYGLDTDIENVLSYEKAEELALKEAAKQAKINAKAAEEDSKSANKAAQKAAEEAAKEDAKDKEKGGKKK